MRDRGARHLRSFEALLFFGHFLFWKILGELLDRLTAIVLFETELQTSKRGAGLAKLIDRFVDLLKVFETTVCRCLRSVHDRVELLGHRREGIIIPFFSAALIRAISSRKRSLYWEKNLKFCN